MLEPTRSELASCDLLMLIGCVKKQTNGHPTSKKSLDTTLSEPRSQIKFREGNETRNEMTVRLFGREVRFAPHYCNLLLQTRLKTPTSITRNKQIIPSLRSSHFPGKMNGVDRRICGRGALIVFEGCDRSGKSTQCGMLVEHLRSTGRCVEHFRFPGKISFLFSFCCQVRSIQDETSINYQTASDCKRD